MEIIFIFTTAFIVGLSGAMAPGPMFTLTITETLRRGFMAAPLIVLGHGILELALVLALLAGFTDFLQQQSVFQTIAVVGGVFLLLMGMGMVRDARQGQYTLSLAGETKGDNSRVFNLIDKRRAISPVVNGFLISLANPYWSIWWITIGLGYITLALKYGAIGVGAFFVGHILADLGWYSLMAGAVSRGSRLFNDLVYRMIIAGCGVFLLGLGVYFLYQGLIA